MIERFSCCCLCNTMQDNRWGKNLVCVWKNSTVHISHQPCWDMKHRLICSLLMNCSNRQTFHSVPFRLTSETSLPTILQHARQLCILIFIYFLQLWQFLMNINAGFIFASCGLVCQQFRRIWMRKRKHVWPCVAAVLVKARSVSHVQLSVSKCNEQAPPHTY